MSAPFAGLTRIGDATSFVDRLLASIEHIRLFEDFERDEIERLAPHLRCYRAPAGSALIREGEQGDFMLLLIDGKCEIVRRDPEGLPQRIGVAGAGRTLGEMSMIDGEPRFASCIALEETLFAVLDRDGLSRIIAEDPRFGNKLLIELILLLSQRLRVASGKLVDGNATIESV
ncbi:MAG TPA: cyclic nucleotide-binding domain-containing protein [Candidatus Desulfobacillus sp.]|nr:cyclic nucleotide-binding domain-containing protein [Candidatus Desulfobacillus sp.]